MMHLLWVEVFITCMSMQTGEACVMSWQPWYKSSSDTKIFLAQPQRYSYRRIALYFTVRKLIGIFLVYYPSPSEIFEWKLLQLQLCDSI